jgi:pimeloyl-ACP methyl ester carboxylesterase
MTAVAPRMPVTSLTTPVLSIGYHELGDGPAVVLLHGFPYDIHAYAEVVPILADAGFRVVVPYLRGHGATRFRDTAIPRSAEQGALASDLIDLIDGLGLSQAIFAGFDWGARAACAAAALWPQRCSGLVSAGGYALHHLGSSAIPATPEREATLWYQYYLMSERGRAGLSIYRREFARLLWRQWSPLWHFSDEEFDRSATAFDNPDWVEVVLHSYRYKFGLAPGDERYAELARRLEEQPPIEVPTVTLDGGAHGVSPASNGARWANRFCGKWEHRVVPGAGHNIPQEQPRAFADAVRALRARGAERADTTGAPNLRRHGEAHIARGRIGAPVQTGGETTYWGKSSPTADGH